MLSELKGLKFLATLALVLKKIKKVKIKQNMTPFIHT